MRFLLPKFPDDVRVHFLCFYSPPPTRCMSIYVNTKHLIFAPVLMSCIHLNERAWGKNHSSLMVSLWRRRKRWRKKKESKKGWRWQWKDKEFLRDESKGEGMLRKWTRETKKTNETKRNKKKDKKRKELNPRYSSKNN